MSSPNGIHSIHSLLIVTSFQIEQSSTKAIISLFIQSNVIARLVLLGYQEVDPEGVTKCVTQEDVIQDTSFASRIVSRHVPSVCTKCATIERG
jgi:hypothetical protein